MCHRGDNHHLPTKANWLIAPSFVLTLYHFMSMMTHAKQGYMLKNKILNARSKQNSIASF